jgi:putative acetyltransferase
VTDRSGDLVVRPEAPEDHAAIAGLVAAAFGSPAEAALVDAIRTSPEYIPELALVAVLDGRVVGHVMVSGAVLVDGLHARPIVMLSPLAVAPDAQRQGIGASLVAAAVAGAEARGEPFLVLEGSPDFYGRLGFEPAADHGITLPIPSWAPPEAAQLVRLTHDDPDLTGHVVYPASFDPFVEG